MESYVDRRIDRFLEDTRRRLAEMASALSKCRRIREDLLPLSQESISKESVKEYRDSFRCRVK